MKTLNTVLKAWANKVIGEVEDYDTSEGVSMQYDLSEEFFNEAYQSRGWDKQVKDNKLTSRTARDHAQTMLEDMIEELL